jgi:aromatic ring-opening dioxygenase catalytic subunit (LigB family)
MVQRRAPAAPEIERLYGAVASCLDEVAPDAIIYVTSDHYNIFFEESLPIFSIGVAPSAHGPSDYPELPGYEVAIDSDLARSIQAHAVASDFDVGMSQEFELDHSVIVPLHFLTPRMDVPIVPVFVSAFVRPIPSSRRCHALGKVIREAVERYPEPRRVAVIATGSFSLEIGGPRISQDSHTGVPDLQWVDRVTTLLRSAQIEELVREATDDQLAQAGNAGGEVLDWIAMLGTIDSQRPTVLEAQRDWGHAYGAWPIDSRRTGA